MNNHLWFTFIYFNQFFSHIFSNIMSGAYYLCWVFKAQWSGACWDMPSKVQAVLLYFATLTTKIEAQCWMGFFGFWMQHFFFCPRNYCSESPTR